MSRFALCALGALAAALAAAVPPAAVAADEAVPAASADVLALVAPGTAVRLRSSLVVGRIRGRVLSSDAESLQVLPSRGAPVRIPLRSLTALEASFGQRRHTREGLVAGVLLGVLIGATAEVDEDRCNWDDVVYCSRSAAFGSGLLGGALLGAGVGALVKTDRWQAIAIDRVSVELAPLRPTGAGTGLALALSW